MQTFILHLFTRQLRLVLRVPGGLGRKNEFVREFVRTKNFLRTLVELPMFAGTTLQTKLLYTVSIFSSSYWTRI